MSSEYNISIKTIYGWLRKQAGTNGNVLEFSRLKRENKLLLELVGRLTLERNLKKVSLLKEIMNNTKLETKQTKTALAKKLGISRGMLYYKHKKPVEDERLKVENEKVLVCHPAYGHKRIAMELDLNKKTYPQSTIVR